MKNHAQVRASNKTHKVRNMGIEDGSKTVGVPTLPRVDKQEARPAINESKLIDSARKNYYCPNCNRLFSKEKAKGHNCRRSK